MDTGIIHLLIIILSFSSCIILMKVLKKERRNYFVIFMITSFLFLMVNNFLFSLFRVIEIFLSIQFFSNILYNYWSLFIKVVSCIYGIVIGLMALKILERKS